MSHIVINIPANQQPQAGYQQPMYQPQPGYMQPQQMYGQPQFQPPTGYAQPQIVFAQAQPGYGQPQPGFQQIVYMQQPQPEAQPILPKKSGGFERLNTRDGVFIKQKVSALEVLTGCDTGNVYHIYPIGKDGDKKGKKLFKAKEQSNCLTRQILSPQCRPFKLKNNLEEDDKESGNKAFLLIDRPCRCTFCCFERPEITVTWVEEGRNEFLGRIREPWDACDIVLDVHDKNGNIKYKIAESCCQLGLCCNCPCEPCETVNFDINLPSGTKVSNLTKKTAGCCTAMISNADNFAVYFPQNAPREDKALLMCAAIFIDFRYFEEKKSASYNRMSN